MELSFSKKVEKIFFDCFFRQEEITRNEYPPEGAILVESVMHKFGFHPGRVAQHKEEIRSLLNEMPDQFHKGKGDGWSFLNMCNLKNGEQWGEHINMEQLVGLGMAVNMVKFLMPRDLWAALPGGMPYLIIDTSI